VQSRLGFVLLHRVHLGLQAHVAHGHGAAEQRFAHVGGQRLLLGDFCRPSARASRWRWPL
jgi:hypothetical protein